ncbi:MAG: T9SS type A sorting domain-containing protein, partial [Bacteroidales bacterium]|nr:T9SS type A sorting domain-containing protein [Bacteroidales bacterium]
TISESDNITDYTDGQCTFTAFPNPTTGNLNIQFDTDLEQSAEYVVCDMFGKTLLHGTINDAFTTVNLNGLANGIYVLQVRSGNQLLGTSKIAKQGL